jgi:hypothetical protein
MKQLVEVGVLEIVSLLVYNAFIILGLFRVRSQGADRWFPREGRKNVGWNNRNGDFTTQSGFIWLAKLVDFNKFTVGFMVNMPTYGGS